MLCGNYETVKVLNEKAGTKKKILEQKKKMLENVHFR